MLEAESCPILIFSLRTEVNFAIFSVADDGSVVGVLQRVWLPALLECSRFCTIQTMPALVSPHTFHSLLFALPLFFISLTRQGILLWTYSIANFFSRLILHGTCGEVKGDRVGKVR